MLWKIKNKKVEQGKQDQKGEGWFAILNGAARVGILVYE